MKQDQKRRAPTSISQACAVKNINSAWTRIIRCVQHRSHHLARILAHVFVDGDRLELNPFVHSCLGHAVPPHYRSGETALHRHSCQPITTNLRYSIKLVYENHRNVPSQKLVIDPGIQRTCLRKTCIDMNNFQAMMNILGQTNLR